MGLKCNLSAVSHTRVFSCTLEKRFLSAAIAYLKQFQLCFKQKYLSKLEKTFLSGNHFFGPAPQFLLVSVIRSFNTFGKN